jgi:DNA-binding NarL/FixJ family response regulator
MSLELIRAILSVAENKIYRSRLFTEVLYWNKQVNIKRDSASGNITLSDREKEILQLLWEEKSNKEIASQLFLSIRSIEKIKQDMKEKLEVKSTIGLLKCAINKQIININARLPKKDSRPVKNALT